MSAEARRALKAELDRLEAQAQPLRRALAALEPATAAKKNNARSKALKEAWKRRREKEAAAAVEKNRLAKDRKKPATANLAEAVAD